MEFNWCLRDLLYDQTVAATKHSMDRTLLSRWSVGHDRKLFIYIEISKGFGVSDCQKYIIKFGVEQAPIEMNSALVSCENKERILSLTSDFPNKQLKR